MGQLALTFWFVLATLFGPSLCCCHAATAAPKPSAPKPVKSCCNLDSAPTDDTPAPKEKSKCPCARITADAFTGVESAAELAGQLRDADTAFAELSSSPFRAILFSAPAPVPSHFTSPPPLSGRALLAAYSILRC